MDTTFKEYQHKVLAGHTEVCQLWCWVFSASLSGVNKRKIEWRNTNALCWEMERKERKKRRFVSYSQELRLLYRLSEVWKEQKNSCRTIIRIHTHSGAHTHVFHPVKVDYTLNHITNETTTTYRYSHMSFCSPSVLLSSGILPDALYLNGVTHPN